MHILLNTREEPDMNATTFDDLEFTERHDDFGGIIATLEFPNGYTASVIRGASSYGGMMGQYEAAVICGGKLCYDTPITDDVLGYLSEADVTKFLADLAALPKREVAS